MKGTRSVGNSSGVPNEPRHDRIVAAKQQIASGEMDTPDRLDEALDRLLDSEMPETAWAA